MTNNLAVLTKSDTLSQIYSYQTVLHLFGLDSNIKESRDCYLLLIDSRQLSFAKSLVNSWSVKDIQHINLYWQRAVIFGLSGIVVPVIPSLISIYLLQKEIQEKKSTRGIDWLGYLIVICINLLAMAMFGALLSQT